MPSGDVMVPRKIFHGLVWLIVAHVLDSVRDLFGWHWLLPLVLTAQIVSVFVFASYAVQRAAKKNLK